MKLPSIKRVLREDLKDAPKWVDGIIEPLNSFMQAVYQTLNHNVTLTENVASFVKELNYNTPSTYPIGLEQMRFKNQLKVKPIGVLALQIYDKANYTPAVGPVYVPWVEDDGDIIISAVTGLAASKSYLLRLVIF